MKRWFTLALAAQASICAADNVSLIHASDPQMNAAIARARQTLPQFFALKNKPGGAKDFVLKVRFSTEYMWVAPFRPDGVGGYQGILKSEPRSTPNMRWGQEVTFSSDQIADWGYTQDGKRMGYFTTCVLISRDPALQEKRRGESHQHACSN